MGRLCKAFKNATYTSLKFRSRTHYEMLQLNEVELSSGSYHTHQLTSVSAFVGACFVGEPHEVIAKDPAVSVGADARPRLYAVCHRQQ